MSDEIIDVAVEIARLAEEIDVLAGHAHSKKRCDDLQRLAIEMRDKCNAMEREIERERRLYRLVVADASSPQSGFQREGTMSEIWKLLQEEMKAYENDPAATQMTMTLSRAGVMR